MNPIRKNDHLYSDVDCPLSQAILDSLSTQIAVINEGGLIIVVNKPWREP